MLALYVIGLYLSLGIIFSFIFLLFLIENVDEGAKGSSWKFKMTVLPGCIVFWPVVMRLSINAFLQRLK